MRVEGRKWISYTGTCKNLENWMGQLEVGDPKIARIEEVLDSLGKRKFGLIEENN